MNESKCTHCKKHLKSADEMRCAECEKEFKTVVAGIIKRYGGVLKRLAER